MERRVVCAAILFDNGDLLVGPRHFDAVMHAQAERYGIDRQREHVQGFLDQRGEFLTREDAFVVATEAKQIIRPWAAASNRLYSECLY